MNNWLNATPERATIEINDEIGFWGISAQEITNQLKEHDGKDIQINVSTFGGSTTDAFAIYNSLRSHNGNVTANIYGDTASSGTIIALAADSVEMADNVLFMVHNAWAVGVGNADELRDLADTLEKVDDNIVNVYKKKTGKNKRQILSLMSKEKWLTAKEAKTEGFVDRVVEPSEILNRTPQIIMNSALSKEDALSLISKLKTQDKMEENIEISDATKSWLDQRIDAIKAAFISKEEETVEEPKEVVVNITGDEEVLARIAALEAENAALKAQAEEVEEDEEVLAKAEEIAEPKAEDTAVEAEVVAEGVDPFYATITDLCVSNNSLIKNIVNNG